MVGQHKLHHLLLPETMAVQSVVTLKGGRDTGPTVVIGAHMLA